MLRTRMPWMARMLALGALAALVACGGETNEGAESQTPTIVLNPRPECPNHQGFVAIRGDTGYVKQQLATVGPITSVPEFHDCQRFVLREEDQLKFGPLVAIFAANILRTLDSRNPNDPGLANPGQAISIGIIYNYDAPYAPLHISTGFNCLYVTWQRRNVRAWMIPVGTDPNADDECARPRSVADQTQLPPANQLHVTPRQPGPFQVGDYPTVARWDYDPQAQLHYIGIRCLPDAWCNIHGHRPLQRSPDFDVANNRPSREQRVAEIKGWYDEQNLATPTMPLAVSGITASAFPHPELGGLNDESDFTGRWQPVAYVAMDDRDLGYQTKFNLDGATGQQTGPPNTPNVVTNQVFLCHGSRDADCSVPNGEATTCPADNRWWARIVDPGGREKYFCVTRRDHRSVLEPLSITIPAVVRWRWRDDDETLWIRCMQYGCCEIGS